MLTASVRCQPPAGCPSQAACCCAPPGRSYLGPDYSDPDKRGVVGTISGATGWLGRAAGWSQCPGRWLGCQHGCGTCCPGCWLNVCAAIQAMGHTLV